MTDLVIECGTMQKRKLGNSDLEVSAIGLWDKDSSAIAAVPKVVTTIMDNTV
jgi:hypothetical protein